MAETLEDWCETMLDKFIYENHVGQRFEGLPNRVFLNYSSLRDYSWNYDRLNSRISRFYRGITSRTLPLVICTDTAKEAVAVMNRLHELTEKDIQAKKPGKVYVGEYYTTGYITESSKSDYLISERFCKNQLTLLSDDPNWYRETSYSFLPGSRGIVATGADYPYDYSYDYAMSFPGEKITLDTICDNAFKLRIYGEATNPVIAISGHIYTISGSIDAGESLLIDSLNKTIVLTTAAGKSVNWFDKRGRDSYIFEPIPSGKSTVEWNGTFGFDLTTIEKRSEPKWI